jgi:MSHA biogenesis protein MshO
MQAVRRGLGVTLIEMVVTIVLMGILATVLGGFIAPMIRAYQAQAQRAALVDAGESALRRVARDVRISLPNSIRITNTASGFAIEMVPTVDGGRYCLNTLANCNGAADNLSIGGTDSDFDVIGCFRNPVFTSAAFPSTAFRLVIGDSTGQVYSASGSPAVVTPSGASITLSVVNGGGTGSGACGASSGANTSFRHHLNISGGHGFPNASPRQRVFVVLAAAAPVTYVCNTSTQTLRRYSGYTFQSSQPTDPAAAPLNAATSAGLVTELVSACSVTGTTGDVQSTGLLTLGMSLTNAGESVSLMSELQLDNSR